MAQPIVYRFSRDRLESGLRRAIEKQKEIGVGLVQLTQQPRHEHWLKFDWVRKCTIEAEEWRTQIEAYYRSEVAPQEKSQDIVVRKAKMAYFEAHLRGLVQSVYQAASLLDDLYEIFLPEVAWKIDFDEFERALLSAVAVEPVKRFVALNVMDDRGWYVLHDWDSTEPLTAFSDVVVRLVDGDQLQLVEASILITSYGGMITPWRNNKEFIPFEFE
jgi:hypothetical protein